MPPAPNRQEDASEADGCEPSDKSRCHAPIRPLFDTEAECLALTLHQLQCEPQRLTAPHHHRQGGRGTLPRGEWKQRLGTKEGTQGLRDMAEARTGVQGPQQWATVIQEQEGSMVCMSRGHLKDRCNQVRCHKEGGPSIECQDKEGSGVCGQHHHKLLHSSQSAYAPTLQGVEQRETGPGQKPQESQSYRAQPLVQQDHPLHQDTPQG